MHLKALPRSETPEWLDAEQLPQDHLAGNLRDIVRVNRYLGGTASVLRLLADLIRSDFPDPRTPITILDAGTGAGDIPRALLKWAEAEGRTLRIWAVDINPDIVRFAVREGPRPNHLAFAVADAQALPLPPAGVDYVIASLFLHHFARDSAVRVLSGFRASARRAVIVNDLHRARLPYAVVSILTRLTTKNMMTRNDAPLSVLRAFLPGELKEMAREAGFSSWQLTRAFPYRLNLIGKPEKDS
jgi:hypothetical protein